MRTVNMFKWLNEVTKGKHEYVATNTALVHYTFQITKNNIE